MMGCISALERKSAQAVLSMCIFCIVTAYARVIMSEKKENNPVTGILTEN